MSTQLDTMSNIHSNLHAALMQQGIAALLPAHVTEEQFTRTAATALVSDPELQQADRQSLILALTRCARDGLLPDGREAALVVRSSKNYSTNQYEKKAVYMPMVDGVLKRARQSGQVSNIIAKAVHASDTFDYHVDENGEHLTHRPAFVEGDTLTKVYAFARLTSGEIVVEVMTREDVEKIRQTVTSSERQSSPWMKFYDRMALKTVVHRLARRLPCASEMFSLLDAGVDVVSQEKTLTGDSVKPQRMRLRDVLMRQASKPPTLTRTIPDVNEARRGVDDTASANISNKNSPQLDALLNALDDTTDEQSLGDVVSHCAGAAALLDEDEKQQLRGKIRTTKARIAAQEQQHEKQAQADTDTQNVEVLAGGVQGEKNASPVKIVPFANTSCTGWRFPDGTVVNRFLEADRKAKALGLELEERKTGRFSKWD